jgi:hypothetical protein
MQTTADPTDPGLTPNPLLASHISKPARDEEERRVSHLLISSSARRSPPCSPHTGSISTR